MRGILVTLSVLFAVYTVLVYGVGDRLDADRDNSGIRSGMRVWQERNCQSCHQLYGLGGYMGPDLTNVASLREEPRIRTFIRYGTGRMPALAVSDVEMDHLIAFLKWVDRSGTSKVPPETVHWTGTYLINEH